MTAYYFPMLFWMPASTEDVRCGPFSLLPRRWEVSIFDLYSLVADRHPIRMPAELMQIFLPRVNLEIEVEAGDHDSAREILNILRAQLYIRGISPTLAPFATSHSLNAYAGINGRSSALGRESLHEGLREGLTSRDTKIEGWPNELSLMCIRGDSASLNEELGETDFLEAAERASVWQGIEGKYPSARLIRTALARAPLMPDMASSILHMWQALENVFGIDREITYRTSLLLAELCSPIEDRAATYATAKKSYGDRSKIAHGVSLNADIQQWMRAWGLLRRAASAILARQAIPSSNDLTDALLAR